MWVICLASEATATLQQAQLYDVLVMVCVLGRAVGVRGRWWVMAVWRGVRGMVWCCGGGVGVWVGLAGGWVCGRGQAGEMVVAGGGCRLYLRQRSCWRLRTRAVMIHPHTSNHKHTHNHKKLLYFLSLVDMSTISVMTK